MGTRLSNGLAPSFIVLSLVMLALSGCISDNTPPASDVTPQPLSIQVSPSASALPTGGETKFSASVSGSGNTAVTWSIQEGAAGGAVTPKGDYTAPASTGTYHVIATSQADPNKSASATIMVSSALDAAFGATGKMSTAIGGIDTINALEIQADGKILVAGASLNGVKTDFALARYMSDGTLDSTFGTNGIVVTPLGGSAEINALSIQPDGKIIAGGDTDTISSSAFALARYHANGTLDISFGHFGSGIVTETPGVIDNRLNALKLQGDKILVGGISSVPIDTTIPSGIRTAFTLMRFQANGSVDSLFGPNGDGIVKTVVQPSGTKLSGEINALALQSTGEIVVAGRVFPGGSAGQNVAVLRYDSNGTLDTTFGTGGFVNTDIASNEQTHTLLIQPDGKILVGGSAQNSFALLRYTTTGVLDTTFDTDGIVTTTIGSGGTASIRSFFFDNNQITVGGISFNGANNSEFTLARYSVSGALDTTFGTGGILRTSVSTGLDEMHAMQRVSGKIVAAGFAADGLRVNFALARYDATTGGLDPAFGTGGLVTTAIGNGDDEIKALAVQTDGKIIAAGFSFGANNVRNKDFALARYDANGVLDTSFGVSGRAITSISSGHDVIHALAVQPDGKIIVGGTAFSGGANGTDDFALARYNTNGGLDTTFGSNFNGVVQLANSTGHERIHAVALQGDGKIVVAGEAFTGSNYRFILARYLSSGSLDTGFGTNGIATTQIGSGSSFGKAMLIQPDGKILLAGTSDSGSDFDFALARYNTNGSLDTAFGTDGIVTTPVGTGHDFANEMKLQADGRIVLAGVTFSDSAPEQFALVRYNTDGTPDTGFGSSSIVTTSIQQGSQPFALAIQPSDGKIVAGGFSIGTLNNRDFTLVRYLTTGTLDPDFAQGGIEISPFSSGMDEIHALAVLSDGKILAGGGAEHGSRGGMDFHLARYTP